ncbi:MAG TPA: efflux RND transporter permease subunit [Elusimicrobiota bacterium]|nr:efflux RND transporter permease subunit [Elusimicrobiota bacterium]
MILSDLSIKKPVFAWMLMISLLLFGGIAFQRMGVSQNPDIDLPNVNISLSWEGAAPEVMENEIVDQVEEAIMSVEGIRKISSTSRYGFANVTAEFDLSKNIDVAVQEVQTKLAAAQYNMPRDMDPPSIQKVNPEDQPILFVGVSGTRSYLEISQYVQDHLKDRFQTIPGVGEVSLQGFIEPNLRVWLDPSKMHNLQLTVDDAVSAIQAQHSELPAGVLQTSQAERNVRVMGEAATAEEFSRISIPTRAGQGFLWKMIRLQDIAEVKEGLADVRRLARADGKTAVGLGIRKQRGANAVEVADRVKKKIADIRKDLPPGIDISVNFDSTTFIKENIHELIVTLVLAVLLTSLVCWLFLGAWTSTLNVFLAIPTALGGTVMVIYFLGFTLNTITLMAISLVIGIVVDDAIVVLENIVRHREEGETRVRAAIYGAREITFSVIVISSAVIAIFLPVAFMKGIIGKYFYQFGVTISVAVAFSLLEAITIAPMRCSRFLEVGHDTWMGRKMDVFMARLTNGYHRLLTFSLNHRWKVILGAAFVFLVSLGLAGKLRFEMLPSQDQGVFICRLQTLPGSSLAFTDNVYKEMEKFLLSRPEVERFLGSVGGGSGGQVNTALVYLTMKDREKRPIDPQKGRPLTQQEFMQVVRKEAGAIPGMRRVAIQDLSQAMGGGRGFPLEFSVIGPEWDKLGEYAEAIRDRLLKSGLAMDVDTSYQVGVPEVRVVPDRQAAAERGVTVTAIARTINSSVGGVRVGKYTKGGRRYDVRVSLTDEFRTKTNDISRLFVRNVRGELIPLSAVTKVLEKPTLLAISRENRERAVAVFGNVAPGKSQAMAMTAAQKIAKEVLPEGYRMVPAGSSEQFKEAFQDLVFALLLGIAIAYMILGAQFNSFIHPFTILLALPFSISGALGALWLSNHSLNMMSMIGILLLMGIVKKNSILLVDFTNVRRLAGKGVRDALLEACPLRLRPILMTSLAIIAGAVPSALTLGPGAELRAPMGVAVIGGVFLSTLLTLFVVPCAYSLVVRFESEKEASLTQEALQALGETMESPS